MDQNQKYLFSGAAWAVWQRNWRCGSAEAALATEMPSLLQQDVAGTAPTGGTLVADTVSVAEVSGSASASSSTGCCNFGPLVSSETLAVEQTLADYSSDYSLDVLAAYSLCCYSVMLVEPQIYYFPR